MRNVNQIRWLSADFCFVIEHTTAFFLFRLFHFWQCHICLLSHIYRRILCIFFCYLICSFYTTTKIKWNKEITNKRNNFFFGFAISLSSIRRLCLSLKLNKRWYFLMVLNWCLTNWALVCVQLSFEQTTTNGFYTLKLIYSSLQRTERCFVFYASLTLSTLTSMLLLLSLLVFIFLGTLFYIECYLPQNAHFSHALYLIIFHFCLPIESHFQVFPRFFPSDSPFF